MSGFPKITVAPNGARLQKHHHARVPITLSEIVETAAACHAAGAGALHLHVRDEEGRHSLDVGRYRETLAALRNAVPQMEVQITTEAAGIYGVAQQLALLDTLAPASASVSVREIARAPELARRVFAVARDRATKVQHILYGPSCFEQLERWLEGGVVPRHMRDAIVVLGQYAPPRPGRVEDLDGPLARARGLSLSLTVCAFGPQEQDCLLAAARRGCALRVGFENNILGPDGTAWADNAAALRGLTQALSGALCEG